MPRSRILYFSSFGSLKGGGQKSLLLLFEHIDMESFVPVCITPEEGSFTYNLKEMGIKNYVVSMGMTKSMNIPRIISTIIKIYKIIKKENIDIIHTDGPRNTFYAGIAAKVACIPVITHIRVVDRPRFDDKIMALLTDHFIFVSKAAKKRFFWLRNKKPSKIIYNSIDVNAFKKYRENYSILKDRGFRIGCIGRIEKAKGAIYLIRTVKKVLKRFPECKFIFIGEADKDYLAQLMKEASPYIKNITFTGHLNAPYEVMKSLDLIVLPSLSEGFSRVILESMAMGKPVIATDVGGNAEAIDNGISGYLVPARDPDVMAEKIMTLLNDHEMSSDFIKAAGKRVENQFGIDKNIKDIERIYRLYSK